MKDLKAIGSEKLQGQDKLKRIMEIARFNENIPNTINETSKSEFNKILSDGNNYAIVRERQGYIIKKNISESETDYIEPMKNRKYYSSYSQALKRLNLVAGELNRVNENETGISMFGEQKKFTLKNPNAKEAPLPMDSDPSQPAPPAPPPVPSPELPPAPMPDEDMGGEDMGGEEVGAEVNPDEDMGGEDNSTKMKSNGDNGMDNDEQVTFKTIQKLTGKLTQKIRTLDNQDGMTSEDIKYVINMVLSSLDLNSLSEEDKDDITKKFEDVSDDTEVDDIGGDDIDGEDMTDDTEVEDSQPETDIPMEGEMGEDDGFEMEDKMYEEDDVYTEDDYGNGAIIDSIFGESKVDNVISKYFEISKKEIVEGREKVSRKKLQSISETRKQMKEVIKLSISIEQELASENFLKNNKTATIVGKTNKDNLVFENRGYQVKITPEGQIL